MGALGLVGDPEGWQHAGYTISAVVNQLGEELDVADARGGSGLRPSWSGPVSEAYLELWARRHGRYGDLIYQAGRAGRALVQFGERLADLMYRASDLEQVGLHAGLHLTADGLGFMLPIGHENLAHEAQAILHGYLSQSENDIKAMLTDVRAAVGDVVTVLESVLDAIADFEALALTVAGAAAEFELRLAPQMIRDYLSPRELAGHVHDIAKLAEHGLQDAADRAERFARLVESDVPLADPADRPAAEKMADTAASQARLLRYGVRADMIEGGTTGLVLANVATAGIVAYNVKRDGLYGAMVKDKDAGLVAGTVTDDAMEGAEAYFLTPEVAESPVGTAVSGLVGVGVGALVQGEVDFAARHPQLAEAGARVAVDAVNVVAPGATSVAHGVEHVVGWEAKKLSSLL